MKNLRIARVAAVGVASLLAISLGACGSSNAASGSASSTATKNANATTIEVATGGTPAPFVTQDTSGVDGQNVELTKAIFDKLPQYKVHFNVVDFGSIFAGMDSGRYQIAANNFTKTPEREQKYIFSDPLYNSSYVAAVPKNSSITKIDSIEDLAGKSIVVCGDGCNIAIGLESYNKQHPGKQVKLLYSNTDTPDALHQVENGKADLYLLDQPSYWYVQQKLQSSTKSVKLGDEAQQVLQKSGYAYLVFPKGQEKLRDDVNKGLKEVIKDGTSKKINVKWFGQDLTPKQDAQ
jgi:polar amino acid transport system substrate-binding protein